MDCHFGSIQSDDSEVAYDPLGLNDHGSSTHESV
jgi:hypothetical protein